METLILTSEVGGKPPMSSWISPPLLGRNGLHCVKFLHQMGKLPLNLTLGEPLALMNKFPRFDDPRDLDVLLVGSLRPGVHDTINYHLFNAVKIEFYSGKCSTASEVSRRGGKYGWYSSTLNTLCKPRKGGTLNSKEFSPTTLVMV
jgi:hypothetical protein